MSNALACFDDGKCSVTPRPTASANVLARFGDGNSSIGTKLTDPPKVNRHGAVRVIFEMSMLKTIR